MSVVICEDIENDAESLRHLVCKYFEEINCPMQVVVYKNGDAFLKDYVAGLVKDVNIVFLDIYMPGTNGVAVAKKVREINNDVAIIFTTVSKDYGLDAYSVYALQYLIKPIEYSEVTKVLKRCTEIFADSLKYIEVLSDRLLVKVYLKDIMYIECFNTAIHIHTTSEVIKTFLPLSEMERKLNDKMFLRTQRSFIVNMSYINDITTESFILRNGKAVPIRRSDRVKIKQEYRDYLSELTLKL
ncbi:MAG: LytTR family DNA-binding domain-containing protein [Oscillospiraceae bacterium]|jgi:DNA-binding LytR/AlgR family response regulator|nr:LytTR family DNA-binding domain-containing protein [Oscillospiraceae bacterium]